MDTERQRHVRTIFDAATSMPESLQTDFVLREAGADTEVGESVLRLLRASRAGERFLSRPLLAPRESTAFEGARLGAYRIVREIGAGGMGVVYQGTRADDAYRRQVAIKVIRPEFHSPTMIDRFLQERQILADLDHPNIARIVDGGTTPTGLPYIVMDYIEGRPIDVFANERKAGLDQRLNLFRQACDAVEYLHEHRVIHRDLKPANMLVTSGGMVKLLDFGIAKLVDAENDAAVKTVPLLTPGYASPEQLASKRTGVGSDVYALGAVLYELLTGERPHETAGRSVSAMIEAVTHEAVRKPSKCVGSNTMLKTTESVGEVQKRLEGDLDSILLKALRQEPEHRYVSAAAFAADVERYQEGLPVDARGGAAVYVASRFVRRHWVRMAASIALTASLGWAGVEEWRVHRLLKQMNGVEAAERVLSEELAASGGAAKRNDPARDARMDESLRQVAHNYQTTFPKLVENPLSSSHQDGMVVQRDLDWLKQMEPLAAAKPELSTQLGRAYLDIAVGQWSGEQASLKDAAGSLATCRRAIEVLKQLSQAEESAEPVKVLERDLSDQMASLPGGRT